MDNYLNYRWPKGPGVQPPPVPSARPLLPRPKKRGVRRWLAPVVAIALCLALLGGVSFWAVNGIANLIAQAEPSVPEDPRPQISWEVSRDSDWSPDDLPWGEPDPSVALSAQPPGSAVTGPEVYEAVLPSMVCVEASHSGRFNGGLVSVGTGGVGSAEGYVLTNYHIIDETVSVRVLLVEGDYRYFKAKVIGFDQEFDLAVLKFDPEGLELTPARLGDSDALSVGERVYAVGNPMGYLLGSMSTGIVSALGRDEQESGSPLGMIQTDTPLNPGNSGGALLNEAGQVVGITSAKITGLSREDGEAVEDAAVIENLGLAIPITDAIPFINHILATGESWRPAMGIQCSAVQVDGRKGIQVAEVTGAAPREAGLKKGDLIVSANGVPVATLVELRRVLYRTGAGEELTCAVFRGGEEMEISFALMDSLKGD